MPIKHWNVDNIVSQLQSCYYNASDPHMDGFYQWGCKQDLYTVKFILDDLINRCPEFVGEPEWITEQEKQQVLRILSRNN
jgi:vancomycin permeability regulator SanA